MTQNDGGLVNTSRLLVAGGTIVFLAGAALLFLILNDVRLWSPSVPVSDEAAAAAAAAVGFLGLALLVGGLSRR